MPSYICLLHKYSLLSLRDIVYILTFFEKMHNLKI